MSLLISQKLGLRIKELRILRKIKQCELADLLGMERSNLTRIESGKQCPSYENLEKIANILNIELQEFFELSHLKNKEELIKDIYKELNYMSEAELRYINKTIKNL